jgi:hypothetical protein
MSVGVAATFYYDESDRIPCLLEGLDMVSTSSQRAGTPPNWSLLRPTGPGGRRSLLCEEVDTSAGEEGGLLSPRSRVIRDATFKLSATFLEDKERRHHDNLLSDHRAEMVRYTSSFKTRLCELLAEDGYHSEEGPCGVVHPAPRHHHGESGIGACKLTGSRRVESERVAEEDMLVARRDAVARRKAALEAKKAPKDL